MCAGVKGKALGSAVLAAVAGLTIVATGALIHLGQTVGGLFDLAAGDLHPLVTELERAGPRRLFADYWVAQRVDLATDEKIVAAPVNFLRYRRYEDTVRDDPAPAYVVYPDSCYDKALEGYFARTGIASTRDVYGGMYALYRPASKVLPEDVLVDWATVRGKDHLYLC